MIIKNKCFESALITILSFFIFYLIKHHDINMYGNIIWGISKTSITAVLFFCGIYQILLLWEKKQWFYIFAFLSLFICIFSMPVWTDFLGIDTLSVYATNQPPLDPIGHGRFTYSFLYDLGFSFGLLNPLWNGIAVFLSILLVSSSMTLLVRTIAVRMRFHKSGQKYLLAGTLWVLFFNPFTIEFLSLNNYYPAFLCYIFLIITALRFLFIHSLWGKALSFIFLCTACCGYQSVIAFYALLAPICLYIAADRHKNSIFCMIKHCFLPGILCGFSLVFSALSIKILHIFLNFQIAHRVSRSINISQNLIHLKEQLKPMLVYTFGFFPPFLLFILCLSLSLFILFSILKKKLTDGVLLCLFFFSVGGCLFYTIFFQLLLPEPWIIARSICPAAGLFGFFLLMILLLHNPIKPWLFHAAAIIFLLFTFILLFEVQRFSGVMHQTTAMDRLYSRQIMNRILELEKKNNTVFKECHVYHDRHWHESYFPEYKYVDCDMKLLAVRWKIHIYFKRYYQKDMKVHCHFKVQDFQRKFGFKDWTDFNPEEQVFCQGKDLYIISF